MRHTARRLRPLVRRCLLAIALSSLVALSPTADRAEHDALAAASLPDTTTNIHIGLPLDYNTTPSAMSGTVDFVFGSEWPGQPSSVYHTFYIPYDRDENPASFSQAHDSTWWTANHPDWIEYKCDRTTVAYELGSPNVPLDITNPAVLQWFERTYVGPALVGTLLEYPGQKFDGIAFDNPAFQNEGNWTGSRCGHYDAAGNWVQQFNGTADDPAYRQAIIAWAKNMQAWIHANYPGSTDAMGVNFSWDPSFPADSNTLLSHIDLDFDEAGFTNGSVGIPPYTDSTWFAKVQVLQAYLQTPGHAWDDNNGEPVSFANLTTAQVQWALANYLLVKNSASYMYITGDQEYGDLYLRPEYSAQIGSATGAMYESQNVYMRDFTNGKAIVNPSSSAGYSVSLPANTYEDLYGNVVGSSISLVSVSGIVLLCISSSNCPNNSQPPTTASASQYTIYNGSLNSAWVSWSYGSDDNFSNTSPTYNGGNSIAFTTASVYGTLYLHNGTGVNVSPYTYVQFALQAGTSSPNYDVQLENTSGAGFSAYTPITKFGSTPVSGSWTIYRIPLSALGASGQTVGGFVLQDESGNSHTTLYVAGIEFTN